jgi:intracellular septation protein
MGSTLEPNQPPWLKPLVDFGPLVAFFVAFKLWDILAATALLIVVTTALTLLGYAMTRKLAVMPLVTLAVVAVFGGLTLWLQDETFIKMKPTIVMGLFAATLFVGLVLGKPLVKYVMQSAMSLDEPGWRALTLRFACFLAAVAGLNEIVWRTQPTETWVNFKVFGIIGLNLLFILAQIPLIRRHQIES